MSASDLPEKSTSTNDEKALSTEEPLAARAAPASSDTARCSRSVGGLIRSWLRLAVRLVAAPLMFLAAGVALLALLGVAQRFEWISSPSDSAATAVTDSASDVDYICPMMCTPPQKAPGRCPVCAMELVPASSGGATGDERSVTVDPATRRIANIRTASTRRIALTKTVRAVGEIGYDEGSLKTISAYVDGRFDQLYVDYTGALVRKGDRLASFYSPELYASQVAFLAANRTLAERLSRPGSNSRLLASARKRLLEFGMTERQIDQLVREGTARSRLDVVAPMQGTVIEKLVSKGDYVKAGSPVFRLADLSTVWLVLELFPEDAAAVRYGQSVEAQLRSLPDRRFSGRVAFVDPAVNKRSRTVRVRVVLENRDGLLRIGEYAKAQITIPLGNDDDQPVYDPELANKWISPRHPHIVRDAPGVCPLCGVELKPAVELGFTDQPQAERTALVIPRSAVLEAADESVVYVETQPGRFEIRLVTTGPRADGDIVILKGLSEGEQVAVSGNFLLDSQMQLAGNPSLIDPTRAAASQDEVAELEPSWRAEIERLPSEDRPLATNQVICPVSESKLGSMGVPPKVIVNGRPVFLCCERCRETLLQQPDTYMAKLRTYRDTGNVATDAQSSSETPIPVPEIGPMVPVDEFPVPEIGTIQLLEASEGDVDSDPQPDPIDGGSEQ